MKLFAACFKDNQNRKTFLYSPRKKRTQVTKIGNESRNIRTDTTEIKRS